MAVVDMTTKAHWQNEASLINHLAHQLSRGRLSIFLGSGVSFNFGLPDWQELLKRLFIENNLAFPPPGYPDKISLLTIASSVRTKYSREEDFLAAVHKALYLKADLTFEALSKDKTFAAIGALVTSSSRGGVSTVMTTNYDDALEIYLESLGLVVDVASSATQWASRADATIYHPHGFLPFSDLHKDKQSEKIILDQQSFSEIIGRTDNPWFQRLVTHLRSSTVLMLGLGSSDQNLLSMLTHAKQQHPSFQEGLLFNGVVIKTDVNEHEAAAMEQQGIFSFEVKDYTDHFPSILFKICQQAAAIRIKQLGI